MSYEKVKRHQQFLAEKGQALKRSSFDFKRATNRNKRLMQLNNALSEVLIVLNNKTLQEAFNSEHVEVAEEVEGKKMKKRSTEELMDNMEDKLCELTLHMESLKHIQLVVGHLAQDATNKYEEDLHMHFLWDNNSTLQMVDDLFYRLMKEISVANNQLHEIKNELRKIRITQV